MNFIQNESKQKLRGGYYTPLNLAVFLARWVKEINPRSILEPSCGDGVFFDAFSKIGLTKHTITTAFEVDELEASRAQARANQLLPKTLVHQQDFLGWALNHLESKQANFDAVVGNPPFIRYQYLPKAFQQRAEEIFAQLNLPFTKHTNAWVPFILASIALLRPGGRLAMIVPAEIIHIPHAQSLRTYLGTECRRVVIIDPEEIWFDNTLQGAVILLAEKRHHSLDTAEGLGIYRVKGHEFLNLDSAKIFSHPKTINGKTVQGKWTRALLDSATLNLIDELTLHPNINLFKDIASVDVGIVTGANHYFLVSNETVERFQLAPWAHPMFGKSDHCPGIIYDKRQHQTNIKEGKPTNFIWFPPEITSNHVAKAYIDYGEQQSLHARYKCRVRKTWYSVPSVYATKIGMLKRAHQVPRLILNKLGALTTDTAYRIKSRLPAEMLVGNFINSLTALSAELEGRHYGGGVLELVPSEIENLLIPVSPQTTIDLRSLDHSIRTLPISQVLQNQDRQIFGHLNLARAKQDQLLGAWQKLCNRRQRVSTEVD